MFNSSQSQLTFTDELDLISQPHDFSQLNFNDFTLPSQTQSDHIGSQVSQRTRSISKIVNFREYLMTYFTLSLLLALLIAYQS